MSAPVLKERRAVTDWIMPLPPTELERYVSADAVAAHLSVERRVVLNLARSGRIPAHPLDPTASKKIWRFKISEIDALLRQNQLGARANKADNSGQVLGGSEKARK